MIRKRDLRTPGPSPHDSTGSRDRSDQRRPITPPRPMRPPTAKGGGGSLRGLAITILVLAVFLAALLVFRSERQEPTPPPNQPTDVAS